MQHTLLPEVEIFKTDISCPHTARQLVIDLGVMFPGKHINFDLEDCDNILRIEGEHVVPHLIIAEMKDRGHFCELLS